MTVIISSRTLLIAALILCTASVAVSEITVRTISASHVEMDTPNYRIVARNGNFTLNPNSLDPAINSSLAFAFFSEYEDVIYWDYGGYTICNTSSIRGNFSDWTHSYERHSNGSVTIYGNATTISGCKWRFGMMFVDEPTLYSLPEMNLTVTPDQAKVSIDCWCPWKDQLRFANPDITNIDSVFLRARLSKATLETGFKFGERYTWIPNFDYSAYLPDDWLFVHLPNVCSKNISSEKITPHRTVPANYDFTDDVGINFPFAKGSFKMTMLTWARSDNKNHTWAQMGLREYKPFEGSLYFELGADIYFEFLDEFFYDPTLALLFTSPQNPPQAGGDGGSPGTPGSGAANLNNLSGSTGTIVAIVVVVAVVLIAAGFIIAVMKSERARDVLMPFRQRRHPKDKPTQEEQERRIAETSQPTPANEEAARKGSSWERAKMPPTSV